MAKTEMHSFWILPKGINLYAERTLEERIKIWGCVPMAHNGANEAANELARYLHDFSDAKDYLAIRVNNRMMLESIHAFMTVRTLSDGYLPGWGLRIDSVAVVPHTELPEMIGILGTLPPYAAWKRLRKLCQEALAQNSHILYKGVLFGGNEDFDLTEDMLSEDE